MKQMKPSIPYTGEFDGDALMCLESLDISLREREVALLLAHGYIQKEIADKLNISPLTVGSHLKNIYRQLEIHKDTDLTRIVTLRECGFTDDPFKKVLAVFFLAISISMALSESASVRIFRPAPLRPVVNIARPPRARRTFRIFIPELQMA